MSKRGYWIMAAVLVVGCYLAGAWMQHTNGREPDWGINVILAIAINIPGLLVTAAMIDWRN